MLNLPTIKRSEVSKRGSFYLPYYELTLVPFYFQGNPQTNQGVWSLPAPCKDTSPLPPGMSRENFSDLLEIERSAFEDIALQYGACIDPVVDNLGPPQRIWEAMWMVHDPTRRFDDDSLMRRGELRELQGVGPVRCAGAQHLVNGEPQPCGALKLDFVSGMEPGPLTTPKGYQPKRTVGYCMVYE